MEMSQNELNEILRKHKLWLKGEEGGERANLMGAKLAGVDLTKADLSRAELTGADLSYADLPNADLSYTDLSYTDLSYANLSYAQLTRANLTNAQLTGADIDYSSLPLWCGSLKANFDDRQLIQIAYHLVKAGLNSTNASNETKEELAKLIDFANKFHRVVECGKIEWRENQ